MIEFRESKIVYENPLASVGDIEGWRMEGDGGVSFPRDRMRMESLRPPEDGQDANIVHWCSEAFPDNIAMSWDFWPLREPGLAMFFFAAVGRNGEDIFDESLTSRRGRYSQYHHGDINALHVSYFRRRLEKEMLFHVCNLRKSHGFHLVSQGPDPIPPARSAGGPYHIKVVKIGPWVQFRIGWEKTLLTPFEWEDEGQSYGPVLAGGKIGFRQMSPLIAEYANLRVATVELV